MKRILLLALCAFTCAAQELKVYAIDVEGGKATLYVSPSGQSMLVDAGYVVVFVALKSSTLIARRRE